MALTRKHFAQIALTLKEVKPSGPAFKSMEDFIEARNKWEQQVQSMKAFCKRENAAFDPSRFLIACNY